jgi:hypothetical protein
MRLLKNKKGQVRVIEAFFASMLLLSVLTLIPTQSNVKNSSEPNLSSTAQQVLLTLDANGYLSKLIVNGSWTQIRQCLLSALPPTIWFNLTVFDENNTVLNDLSISNGNSISQETYSFDYLCVSQNPTYVIYLIRLQLAVVS